MGKEKSPPWSRSEIAVLREHYPLGGLDAVCDLLADRSWHAIHQKAFKLGLKSEKIADAPVAKLRGENLEQAIRLREEQGWSFARIGAKFGVAEAAACNAVLIALCPRKGFTPAQRDQHGRLTAAGLERVRYALKKGLKGVDIQLRLGVSAGCVAEQRRRYNRELKANGKALLPPPGGGEAYSGVKLTKAQRAEVENLFLQGLGTAKISDRTGVSKTSCTRIRNRLIRKLRRGGKSLPGCDAQGTRREVVGSAAHIPASQREALRELILQRVPIARAAQLVAMGSCSAYRVRDELEREFADRGESLPGPIRPGRMKQGYPVEESWPPKGTKELFAFRALLQDLSFDDAKAEWRRRKREAREQERAARDAERARPKSFEEQLARVARGEIGIAPAIRRAHLEPHQLVMVDQAGVA